MDFKTRNEELRKKYEKEIAFIEERDKSLPGVAWEKLKAHARGIEPCPFVNMEELKKDCAELSELAEKELGLK